MQYRIKKMILKSFIKLVRLEQALNMGDYKTGRWCRHSKTGRRTREMAALNMVC